MKYVSWFSELGIKDVDLVGGKGASLGELYGAKFPIPSGFCLTSAAYRKVLEDSGLNLEIKRIFDGIDINDTADLEIKSSEIRELILGVEIPAEIKNEILEAYENLNVDHDVFKNANKEVLDIISGGREDAFVAVRSSVSMDQDVSSGQQETFLNVKGKEKLLNSVKKCWASLFSSGAVFYRGDKGFDHMKAYLSVIIQKMVNSESSGVMYSINPNNNEEEIVIKAGYGLGEAIVSGAIDPDLYVVGKEKMDIKSKEVKKKSWMFVRDHSTGETIKRNVGESLQEKQVISDYVIEVLSEIAVKIEEHYKKPQDIEWAVENNKVYIVQSRPLVVLEKKVEEVEVISTGVSEVTPEVKEEVKEVHEDMSTVTQVKAIVDVASVAESAAKTGADGVGLLRSEFLIGGDIHPGKLVIDDRNRLVESIYIGLRGVAKAFEGKPVWYRTLDLRSDKYNNLEGSDEGEDNPMIGWRGIRRDLDQVELLKAQFMAIKRVHDDGLTNVGVMLPMVSHAEQVKRAKEIMLEVGLRPLDEVEFGVMIETPAAVGVIEEICNEGVDFVSFGTNDLTQFTLGLDRNNSKVKGLYDEMHPAVLKQIKEVISVCKKYNVETSICGQAGSRPEMVEFLVKSGIDSISTNPDSVSKIKHVVYRVEKKLLLDAARNR